MNSLGSEARSYRDIWYIYGLSCKYPYCIPPSGQAAPAKSLPLKENASQLTDWHCLLGVGFHYFVCPQGEAYANRSYGKRINYKASQAFLPGLKSLGTQSIDIEILRFWPIRIGVQSGTCYRAPSSPGRRLPQRTHVLPACIG